MFCRRCGHRFNRDEGFAGVHFATGNTALEQLRSGRTIHLCGECAEVLKTWLGLVAQPPELPQPEVSDNGLALAGRPFEKYWEE